MDAAFTTLVIGVVGTLFGTLLTRVFDGYRARTRDRIREQLWGFLREEVHVFLPIGRIAEGAQDASAGYGDLLGVARIVSMAGEHFGIEPRLHPAQVGLGPEREENLIVLGGGKYNPIYRELVAKLQPPLHFFDTATDSFESIRNEHHSIVYSPVYGKDGNLEEDVGFAVRAKNPFNPRKWVVIAAGGRSFGTAAAVKYLTDSDMLKKQAMDLDKNLEIVVGGTVVGASIVNVKQLYLSQEF